MAINETQRLKLILLLLLLISSIFILGCSTHGKKDEEDVRYEFCAGKFFYSPSQSYNMLYFAVNQSNVNGSVKDSMGTVLSGTSFRGPVNPADDDGGRWIADGFSFDTKNPYTDGNYTLQFSIKAGDYEAAAKLNWENIPNWSNTPQFNTASVNEPSHIIYISSGGIIKNQLPENYKVKYRIKVYNADDNIRYSQLFGQSTTYSSASSLEYSLPPNRSNNSYKLLAVLVCEIYNQNGKIEKIMYYPDGSNGKYNTFTYNP